MAGSELTRAAELAGARDALRAQAGALVPPVHSVAYERTLDTVRSGLGEAGFAAAHGKLAQLAPPDIIEAIMEGEARMSSQVRELMASGFGQLRHEPTAKRIQAVLGGDTIVDSTRAVLVWEPRRIVPSYAVPVEDVRGDLVPAGAAAGVVGGDVGVALADVTALRVLDPRVPFTVHSTTGEAVDLRAAGQVRPGAGFRPADPDLAGLVILDFAAFDAWYEEDELNVAHPRDPFHRIDVLPSSRQVRLELDGQLLAVSSRPVLLFETMLPTRYYLPRADVTAELVPSPTTTWCAYKGEASYFSVSAGGRLVQDIAWSYPDPQHDAARVRDLIAFFDERIDVILDGERRARPVTPWSDGPGA